jgi:mannose-6-phosphate isomerase-like protein (cupin superfamily)
MEKRPVRRIVTGHDEAGKAVVLFDGPTPYVNQRGEGNVVQLCWITNESPVDLSHTRDQAAQKTGVPPPKAGSICRVVDFAPQTTAEVKHVDHHEILKQMGIDPATQGYQRHTFTHRTRSIDYAICIEGEIDMLLDDTQVHMKAGDIMVQQGTNHAWVNTSGKPCRICFVLIDSQDPPAWKKDWKPKG